MLGAEVLFGNILRLGLPGLFVAWVVTPTVIIFMYQLGTRVFKIKSKALVIIIAAATSVCGVSAAIAAAVAARAKAEQIAAVVKMIQNTLIGVVAFVIAVFWVTRVEERADRSVPNAMEVWHRFPKFILGFVASSVVFSFVLTPMLGDARVEALLEVASDFRSWLFCLAFVSIGLESSFRALSHQLTGGRPIQLYLVGQTFNLVLTLVAAYLAFGGVLFDRISVSNAHSPTSHVVPNVISENLEHDRNATALFYTEVSGWGSWIREK